MSRVLPFWWSESAPDKELTVLMPVYFHRSSGQGEERRSQTYWGGNIWIDTLQHGIRERGFLWPFTRYQSGPDTTRLDVLGLFSNQHQAERDALRISPFYFARKGTPGRLDPVAEWLHLYSRQEHDEEVRTRIMPFLYGSRTRPGSVGFLSSFDGVQNDRLRDFLGTGLHHHHGVLAAGDDEFHSAGVHLFKGGVDDHLAVHVTDAAPGDGAIEGDGRDGEGCGRSYDGEHVRWVLLIG